MVDVAEVNQRQCLEESGQWLENVDRTHLVLASGKLVLQKRNICNLLTFSPILTCRWRHSVNSVYGSQLHLTVYGKVIVWDDKSFDRSALTGCVHV